MSLFKDSYGDTRLWVIIVGWTLFAIIGIPIIVFVATLAINNIIKHEGNYEYTDMFNNKGYSKYCYGVYGNIRCETENGAVTVSEYHKIGDK